LILALTIFLQLLIPAAVLVLVFWCLQIRFGKISDLDSNNLLVKWFAPKKRRSNIHEIHIGTLSLDNTIENYTRRLDNLVYFYPTLPKTEEESEMKGGEVWTSGVASQYESGAAIYNDRESLGALRFEPIEGTDWAVTYADIATKKEKKTINKSIEKPVKFNNPYYAAAHKQFEEDDFTLKHLKQ